MMWSDVIVADLCPKTKECTHEQDGAYGRFEIYCHELFHACMSWSLNYPCYREHHCCRALFLFIHGSLGVCTIPVTEKIIVEALTPNKAPASGS